jgi:hypothetical protein
MLLALTCFIVLIIVMRALGLHRWLGAVIAAALTIAMKPYLASVGLDWRLASGMGIGAMLLLLPYYLGPLQVYRKQRASAVPAFDRFDASMHPVPDFISTSVESAAAALLAVGFERVGDIIQSGHLRSMSTRVAFLEKPSTGQQALCVGIYRNAEPVDVLSFHVELFATFTDGRALVVNNVGMVGVYGPVVGKRVEKLASVDDPARLAAIHAVLVERARGDASLAVRDRSLDLPDYLTGLMIREMELQVPLGYLRLDRTENAYRPTRKGAVLMCWKLLPPFVTLARARMRRREAQLLAELEPTRTDAPVTAPAAASQIAAEMPVTALAASPSPATARPPVTARPASASPVTRRLSWAGVAGLGLVAAYLAGGDTAPAGALEPAARVSVVPADFEVPNDFPGAVRALERLAGTTAGPLMVRDSLGARTKASGAVIGVRAEMADSLITGAQPRFLERGFFLFRHEPNYGIDGRPDEVALVPMWDQYRIVKLVGTNGVNFNIANADVIAWLRALEQDAPFVLTGIGDDHIAGRFTGVVADPDAMAQRLYKFCPDVVDQGTGSVTELASELRRTHTFFCWWD